MKPFVLHLGVVKCNLKTEQTVGKKAEKRACECCGSTLRYRPKNKKRCARCES